MHRLGLPLILFVGLACSPDSAPAPTAPTTVAPPVVQPTDTGSEPQFDDQFWRDLVYSEYDGTRQNLALPLTQDRHFYILLKTAMPVDLPTQIQADIPRLWRQLTGEPFAGRVSIGDDASFAEPYSTMVRADVPPDGDGLCGRAHAPLNEHRALTIWLHSDDPDRACGSFRETFAHEFGHALGFFHVEERGHVMSTLDGHDVSFTAKEQHHAQLAYRAGRAPYCGEPGTDGCP